MGNPSRVSRAPRPLTVPRGGWPGPEQEAPRTHRRARRASNGQARGPAARLTRIDVAVLNEGSPTWRPVEATPLGGDRDCIEAPARDRKDESRE